MKKIIIFIILFFITPIFAIKASAATDGWIPGVICANGFHNVDKHLADGLFRTSRNSQQGANISRLREYNACIRDNVTDVFDVDTQLTGIAIYYCTGATRLGYVDGKGWADRNDGSLVGSGNIFLAYLCCSNGYDYLNHTFWGSLMCCEVPPTTASLSSCGVDSSGVEINKSNAELDSYSGSLNTSGDFIEGIDAFTCPADYCYVVDGVLTGLGNVNTTEDKTGKQCLSNYGPDTAGVYCIDGLSVTQEDYEDYISVGAGVFNVCGGFPTEEKNVCLDCYKDCPTKDTCSYSSLGCIQTTQNGIIVRIFQIGLGVVGALAIARFIQAALLRQTADPSKIQESYDIITSIIIGIVVLLGSTVILRFIGVDILQMLPF